MEAIQGKPFVPLPPVLRRYWVWTIILTLAAYGTKAVNKLVLHLPPSYNYPFFPRSSLFSDIHCWVLRFKGFHHMSFFSTDPRLDLPFAYPAPVALAYEFFYILPRPILSYLMINAAGVLLVAFLFSAKLRRLGIATGIAAGFAATCVLCSWPAMVTFFVANMEIVNGFVVGLGLYFFLIRKSWWAALFLSIAASAKLFPFIFIGLFLARKQYRQIAFFLAIATLLNVFSMWLVSGSVLGSMHGISRGMEYLRSVDVLPFNRLAPGVEHSLFGFLKAVVFFSGIRNPSLATMSTVLRIYLGVAASIGVLLYFLRIRFLQLPNQILCLVIASILFTPLSIDYTLMHLYVPFGMMCLTAIELDRKGESMPGLNGIFLCFALLLSPLCEFMFHGMLLGALIKTLVLIAALIIALRFPFGQSDPLAAS